MSWAGCQHCRRGESVCGGDTNAPPSPSVPVRFCIATEEILRLTWVNGRATNEPVEATAPAPKPRLRSPH